MTKLGKVLENRSSFDSVLIKLKKLNKIGDKGYIVSDKLSGWGVSKYLTDFFNKVLFQNDSDVEKLFRDGLEFAEKKNQFRSQTGIDELEEFIDACMKKLG